MALNRHGQMTHYLKDFTELLHPRTRLDAVKADFLQKAESAGMSNYLRENAVSQKTVEHRVKEEISNFMTAQVADIIEARGLIDQSQIELLGFVHDDPTDDFIAAVRDAVQVSFVYQMAAERHKKDAARHERALKNASAKVDVQKLVQKLATDHPTLAGPPTAHALDEMIAALHASDPWMRDLST